MTALDRRPQERPANTVTGGHRALDILHVATALQQKADQLFIFDSNQAALARAAGLEVKP